MANPLLRRKKILAVKSETTVGTAETLAAANGAMNVFDAELQTEQEYIERMGQGSLSPIAGSIGMKVGIATFSIELIGGSSVPYCWTHLFPACGLPWTALVAAPVSLPPAAAGATAKTVTIGLYEDGLYKQIYGAMGTFVLRATAGQPVMLDFTFRGAWTTPSAVAAIAPTYPTTAPLRMVSAGFTMTGSVGAWAPLINELTIDLGNELTPREDVNSAGGVHSFCIGGRRITGTIDPESVLPATAAIFADCESRYQHSNVVLLDLGGAGNGMKIEAPALQITTINTGDRDGKQIDTIDFQLNRLASAGDDEIEFTCQ